MEPLRVACAQFQHESGVKEANFTAIERLARAAVQGGAHLLVLPECCITGYWFLRKLSRPQLDELAEPVPAGVSTQRLLGLSAKLNLIIGAGLIEREGSRLFNSYVVALPDGRTHVHRKIQAFESDHITPGDRYTVFDITGGWRVGVLICYDNNIIENVRITALMGADLLLAPHQTGGCDSVSPHGMKPVDRGAWDNRRSDPQRLREEFAGPKGRGWLMRWLPSRAHDNGLFLAFANGVGEDDDEIRTGGAMILDPYGRTLAESTSIDEDLVFATLDPALLDRCTGRRWLRARRPELYAPLATPTGNELPTRQIRFTAELPGDKPGDEAGDEE